MAYRQDSDLEFLAKCSDRDLDDLVNLLIYDNDGKKRWTEELSNNRQYKEFVPRHSVYWREIAAEIQCYGGNTIATLLRGGKGVCYRKILIDVCNKLKVNFNAKSRIEVIEQNLLLKILSDSLDNMSSEDIKVFAMELGLDEVTRFTPEAVLSAFQYIFRAGGFRSYQVTLKFANLLLKILIGRGLTLAGNQILVKALSILTGPIGWTITAAWTIVDVGGTAYRVTIPAVIQVAVLRAKVNNNIKDSDITL
ncbi:DUF3944 domain-containing protein [Escherichia coli]|nr:DUF3944 domain-containing protein [Escherichia coli]EFH8367369.1 DUF3944 domain-containing protein [Escherichia coli]HBD3679111.1 DUF3944 domain-containing protein [Escherichia coli]HBE5454788.1 DUF3944 domain-containing protein [Escherichia coli]HDD9133973.1 DUF3944 domain-containing protein [Escherichia coli]